MQIPHCILRSWLEASIRADCCDIDLCPSGETQGRVWLHQLPEDTGGCPCSSNRGGSGAEACLPRPLSPFQKVSLHLSPSWTPPTPRDLTQQHLCSPSCSGQILGGDLGLFVFLSPALSLQQHIRQPVSSLTSGPPPPVTSPQPLWPRRPSHPQVLSGPCPQPGAPSPGSTSAGSCLQAPCPV